MFDMPGALFTADTSTSSPRASCRPEDAQTIQEDDILFSDDDQAAADMAVVSQLCDHGAAGQHVNDVVPSQPIPSAPKRPSAETMDVDKEVCTTHLTSSNHLPLLS